MCVVMICLQKRSVGALYLGIDHFIHPQVSPRPTAGCLDANAMERNAEIARAVAAPGTYATTSSFAATGISRPTACAGLTLES